MQIVGPVPVAGRHDSGVTAVAPAAPGAPVSPAAGGSASGQTRSDTGERGQTSSRPPVPTPDPDRPAGPPPAFDTTPLELEQERRQSQASVFWHVEAAAAREAVARTLDKEI